MSHRVYTIGYHYIIICFIHLYGILLFNNSFLIFDFYKYILYTGNCKIENILISEMLFLHKQKEIQINVNTVHFTMSHKKYRYHIFFFFLVKKIGVAQFKNFTLFIISGNVRCSKNSFNNNNY